MASIAPDHALILFIARIRADMIFGNDTHRRRQGRAQIAAQRKVAWDFRACRPEIPYCALPSPDFDRWHMGAAPKRWDCLRSEPLSPEGAKHIDRISISRPESRKLSARAEVAKNADFRMTMIARILLLHLKDGRPHVEWDHGGRHRTGKEALKQLLTEFPCPTTAIATRSRTHIQPYTHPGG
jgi:hypothetical protein